MPLHISPVRQSLVLVLLAAAGCVSRPTNEVFVITACSTDGGMDASADLPRDTSADLPRDTSADLPRDTSADLPRDTAPDTAPSTVIFQEDFNGSTLSTQWTAMNRHGDYSNNELQCYTPANVVVGGGNLSITSKLETRTCGDAFHTATSWSYTSGAVQWKSFGFRYGTIEVRAKTAGGKGPWPAIWLLGTNCQQTNPASADNSGSCNWPQAGSDEIDFVELLNGTFTRVNQQIHSAGNSPGCSATVSDTSLNWHTYQLIWAAGSLTWKIDGVQTCKITSSVPSTPMFLIINTAMGGAGGAVTNSTLPQTMQVDYVTVTQPGGTPPPDAGADTAPPPADSAPSSDAGTVIMGDPVVQATEDFPDNDLMNAMKATLSRTATLQSLSLYVSVPAGSVRMGVYDATGPNGGPGAKKAETVAFTPTMGWNTVNVTSQVSLPAGTYWLVFLPSSASLHVRAVLNSGQLAYYTFPYGPLPATYSTSPHYMSAHWSFYATLK